MTMPWVFGGGFVLNWKEEIQILLVVPQFLSRYVKFLRNEPYFKKGCVPDQVLLICFFCLLQVDFIINEATNLDNLALLYEGWTPWVWKLTDAEMSLTFNICSFTAWIQATLLIRASWLRRCGASGLRLVLPDRFLWPSVKRIKMFSHYHGPSRAAFGVFLPFHGSCWSNKKEWFYTLIQCASAVILGFDWLCLCQIWS